MLVGLAALGATAVSGGVSYSAQRPAGTGRRIDVHHHFAPPEYVAFVTRHGRRIGSIPGRSDIRTTAFPGWRFEEDLGDMEASGIETAFLSITTPGFLFGEREEVRRVVRQCNEYAARLMSDHPGRFGSCATIPLTDTEGALREIEYVLDTLKGDGFGVYSNYGDRWLGDPSFAPVYEELNRRRAVVVVHPIDPNCCRDLVPGLQSRLVEYGTDTARTIASLIFSGTTTRYPDIRWIFSHGGGTMPFLIERFLYGTAEEVVPGVVTKGQGGTGVVGSNPPPGVPNGALHEIRRLYFDTAQVANPVSLAALRSVVGISQIVFGTDYWYRSAQETVRGIVESKVFSPAELYAIDRGNMERLVPRLQTQQGRL